MRSHTHCLLKISFVNLASRTCSCNLWTLVDIPCRHVVYAIQKKKKKRNQKTMFMPITIETYAKCYRHTISPINGEDRLPKDIVDLILPSIYKVGLERPKILRRREPVKIQDQLNWEEKIQKKMQEMPKLWTYHSNLQRVTCGSCWIWNSNSRKQCCSY